MKKALVKGIDNDKLEQSIIANCGELTFVAEDLGIDYATLESAVAKSKKLQEAMRIGREILMDTAERCLLTAMKNGNSSIAKFVLQNLGMNRGWLPDNPQAAVQVNVLPPSEQARRVRAIFGLPEDDQKRLEDKDQ